MPPHRGSWPQTTSSPRVIQPYLFPMVLEGPCRQNHGPHPLHSRRQFFPLSPLTHCQIHYTSGCGCSASCTAVQRDSYTLRPDLSLLRPSHLTGSRASDTILCKAGAADPPSRLSSAGWTYMAGRGQKTLPDLGRASGVGSLTRFSCGCRKRSSTNLQIACGPACLSVYHAFAAFFLPAFLPKGGLLEWVTSS